MISELNNIIDRDIRPQLALHGGDLHILSFQEGVFRFELLGQCAHCPAATITTEELIAQTLMEQCDFVKEVVLVDYIDEDLLAQARAMLSRPRVT